MFPVISRANEDYGVNTFVDSLSAYNANTGVDVLLDLVRILNESGNYMWYGLALPTLPEMLSNPKTNFPAYATLNGTLAVPPGSYVVSLTSYNSLASGNRNFGFKAKLFDKGTKASIFYGDYSLDSLVMSSMQEFLTNPNMDDPFGPSYLTSPFIITPPGNLNWEIVNMSPEAALIQVLVQCAVPINNQTLNTREIKK